MKKNAFRIRKTWQSVTAGAIAGIITLTATVSLLAVILVKIDIPSDYVKYLLFVPAVISGAFSGGIAGKYVKSRGFLWGSISSLIVSVICVIILLSVNSFNVNLISFLLIPVFALTGSVGGIIASNLK